MDRVISMILRMVLGKGLRAAMSAWQTRQADNDAAEGRARPDPGQARQARDSAKNARQAMRVMRRMGRF
jgi:hypothetical protein